MKHGKNKKTLGQYFTKNLLLQNRVFDFILNSPDRILEPCIGEGDLVAHIVNKLPDINFTMFEIDESLSTLSDINRDLVRYCDFLKTNVEEKYDTVVGNPPYIRTKKGNLYIDFIVKCFELLNTGGELIFIVPSDFFKLTSSSNILTRMISAGTFTHIYHPHNENMFENANIDILVFRYCKDQNLSNEILYNDAKMYLKHNNGLVTFHKEEIKNYKTLEDIFKICVGLVSGKEEVYKNSILGNIDVLNDENRVDKYIFTEKFPTENIELNTYLLKNKELLLSREIKKFTEKNWYEWGAPRNLSTMRDNMGKSCIYMNTITRKETIAFTGKVQYFGGGLLMLLPRNDISADELKETVRYLNSSEFKTNFMFSGRFKIGQRQLCKSQIHYK